MLVYIMEAQESIVIGVAVWVILRVFFTPSLKKGLRAFYEVNDYRIENNYITYKV